MLKRVFISILILSALSSEGLLNLPLNLYNLYVLNTAVLGIEEGQDVPPVALTDDQADIAVLCGSDVGLAFTGYYPNDIEDGSDVKDCPFLACDYLPAGDSFVVSEFIYNTVKDVDFQKSDSSPPVQVI